MWWFASDESSFCNKDLLRSFSRLQQGRPSTRSITNQNAEQWSLLPAILIDGVLAMTTTINTFKGAKFEHFLCFDLVSPCHSTMLCGFFS
jgi:hypothetical protein